MEPLRVSLDWRGEGDRERDRETNRQRDRDSDRQTDRPTERERERPSERFRTKRPPRSIKVGGIGYGYTPHQDRPSAWSACLSTRPPVRLPFSLFRSLSLSPSLSLRRLFVFSPSPHLPPRREREEARSQGEKNTRKKQKKIKKNLGNSKKQII